MTDHLTPGRHSSQVLREQVRKIVRRAELEGAGVRFEVFNTKERGVVEDEMKRLGTQVPHSISVMFAAGPPWDGKEYDA